MTITGWGTVLGSSTYGLATNAAAMRSITAQFEVQVLKHASIRFRSFCLQSWRPSSAQQARRPQPKDGVKFESTTQLVVVNVSVKDKNGKPLEGLKASDFTVTEDGKPQQIKVFEYQRLEDACCRRPG